MRCYGDLHLDAIVPYGRHVLMFDCIEFGDTLRGIGVTCDLAFALMVLRVHGRAVPRLFGVG
ncbi:MAG TPA: hypothetical protein VJS18_10315 [Paraburkholderia sp.]|nr:hypothetical protein [Paraburkholderia sp.]